MAGSTDFLPFATGVGANVASQSAYAGASSTTTGFQSGTAPSNLCNKSWRQSSFVAAGIATFTANQLSINVADDGNLTNFVSNFSSALTSLVTSQLTGYATQAWVNSQGFATQTWVISQGYATQTWVISQSYATTAYASNASNLSSGLVNPARLASSPVAKRFLYTPDGSSNLWTTVGFTDIQGSLANGQLPSSIAVGGSISAGANSYAGTNGDLSASRGAGGSGVVFLGSASTYLYFNGGTYAMPGFPVQAAGFQIVSDERLKQNIQAIPDALAKVCRLRGVTFEWRQDGRRSAGVIAQDVERELPHAVAKHELLEGNPEGYLAVEQTALIGLLVEALKEERSARQALEARVAALENRL